MRESVPPAETAINSAPTSEGPYSLIRYRSFFQDIPSADGCARYFGAAVAEVRMATIEIEWGGPRQLAVTAITDGRRHLDWNVTLTSSAITTGMNAVGSLLPEVVWRHPWFLAGMGAIAGPLLRAGKVRFAGRAPNRHRFVANPHLVWLVADSNAALDGVDLGAIGPSPTPGHMGDFWLPQRGVFAIGRRFLNLWRSATLTPDRSCDLVAIRLPQVR